MEDRHSWRRSQQASRSRDKEPEERWQWRADSKKERPLVKEKGERRGKGSQRDDSPHSTEVPRRKRQREISPWLMRSRHLDIPSEKHKRSRSRESVYDSSKKRNGENNPSQDCGASLVLRTRSAVAERGHKKGKRRKSHEQFADDERTPRTLGGRWRHKNAQHEDAHSGDAPGKSEYDRNGKYGYGSSKPPSEKKDAKPPKTKTIGFGYGASKLVAQDGSESGSEYTSDDSSDDDSSDDVASGQQKQPQQSDEKCTQEKPSPCASAASSKSPSDHSKESSAEEDQSDVQESTAGCDTADAIGSQSWIANVDGERLRTRSKVGPGSKGEAIDGREVVTKAGEDEVDLPAVDAYVDPYLDDNSENQAIAPDVDDTRVENGEIQVAESSTQARVAEEFADQEGQATSSTAVVDPYLLDAEGDGQSEPNAPLIAKTSKRSRWRKRVSWQPPPALILPDTHDVAIGYDLERSQNTPESRVRRARREECPKTSVTAAQGSDLENDKVPGYLSKCKRLMEALEEGEPIALTVKTFWGKLDAAERERFSHEFPEIAQFAVKN